MANKVVVSVVSIFLVVGVVIGAVVSVNRFKGGEEHEVAHSNKMVNSICSTTDDKELCTKTLGSASESDDPKEYYKLAIQATIKAINASMGLPEKLFTKVGDKDEKKANMTKMGLDDCKDLLRYAVEDLQTTLSTMGKGDITTIYERVDDLRTWLTAVSTYQASCSYGLETQEDIKQDMEGGLRDATKLTYNVLAMLNGIDKILGEIGLKLNLKANPSSRRLLGEDGYPTWLSGADRKLLAANDGNPPPDAVVAQDGSGAFKTISEALAAYKPNAEGRYVIYVKAGVYKEYVVVDKNMANVVMYGDGSTKSIITGDKSFAGGINTMNTATVAILGAGFLAKGMGFQNTAGAEGHQAVALRTMGDNGVFFDCKIDAYQDTLYVHANRQFFRNCEISGTIDFIFGNSGAIIQNSKIIVRKPMPDQSNLITAHGRQAEHETSGLIIHNCMVVPEAELQAERLNFPTFLGRPWRPYSRTVFMESDLGDFIQPEGWHQWDGKPEYSDTCYYAEYGNRGASAKTDMRVKWKGYKGLLTKEQAQQFTVQAFFGGDRWITPTGVPFLPSFVA